MDVTETDEVPESDLINFNDFLTSYATLLEEDDFCAETPSQREQFIMERMGTSADVIEELHKVCGIETLTCEGEVERLNPTQACEKLREIPEDLQLSTVEMQKKEIEKRKNLVYKQFRLKLTKYRFLQEPMVHVLKSSEAVLPEECVQLPELLISVRVHNPFHFKGGTNAKGLQTLVPDEEWQVLGQHFLTNLRDKITCLLDDVVPGEFSENPDHPKDVKCKDLYKSGFFFIEDTFYNDMRDPNNRDYSQVIIDWGKRFGMGPYTTDDMASKQFFDLSVRMGHPYLFVHQGDCEHIMVFTDVRLMHPEDCQKLDEYPLNVGYHLRKRPYCQACLKFSTQWLVKNSELTPDETCFMCNSCMRALHYDSDGQKIVQFEAYPFRQDESTCLT